MAFCLGWWHIWSFPSLALVRLHPGLLWKLYFSKFYGAICNFKKVYKCAALLYYICKISYKYTCIRKNIHENVQQESGLKELKRKVPQRFIQLTFFLKDIETELKNIGMLKWTWKKRGFISFSGLKDRTNKADLRNYFISFSPMVYNRLEDPKPSRQLLEW